MDAKFVRLLHKAVAAAVEGSGKGLPSRIEISGVDIPKDSTVPDGAILVNIKVVRNDKTTPGHINVCWE